LDNLVAGATFELKHDTPQRLPAMDALIAACAKTHDAVSVHRDPHISQMPTLLLKQEFLPPRT
jgi:predicted nucleic acid-binding protein